MFRFLYYRNTILRISTHPSFPRSPGSSILYYISIPTEDAHSGHPTGNSVAGFSQRINEKVAMKLVQIVGEGIVEIKQV